MGFGKRVFGGGAVAIALVLGACVGAPGVKTAAKSPVGAASKSPSPKGSRVPSPVPSLGLLLEGRVTVAPGAILAAKLGQATDSGVKIISNNGGGIISDNGLGLISDNGLGVVAATGGAYRVQVASGASKPVEGMWVKAINLYDGQVLAGPVATGADGSYKLGFVKAPSKNMRIVAVVPGQEGEAKFSYATLIPPSPAPVLTSDSTRTVTYMLQDALPLLIQGGIDRAKSAAPPGPDPKDPQVFQDFVTLLNRIGPKRLAELDVDGAVARGVSERLLAVTDLTLPVFGELLAAVDEVFAFEAAMDPPPAKPLLEEAATSLRSQAELPQGVAIFVKAGMEEAKATELIQRLKTKWDAVTQILTFSLLAHQKEVYAPLEAEAK